MRWAASEDRNPHNSYGNGSAMQVPIGFAANSLEETMDRAPSNKKSFDYLTGPWKKLGANLDGSFNVCENPINGVNESTLAFRLVVRYRS